MAWIRRRQPEHTCELPKGEAAVDDLWRCDSCTKLWRVTYHYGDPFAPSNRWEAATVWQRIRYYWAAGATEAWLDEQLELPPPVADPPRQADAKTPPDTSWIRTETISGSGKRSGPHPLDPPRQTGTDWLYSVEEGKA